MDDEIATVVVKQETDSSQEPAPECSTTWSPIDDDDDDGPQHTGLGFCQIFIKEEAHRIKASTKREAESRLPNTRKGVSKFEISGSLRVEEQEAGEGCSEEVDSSTVNSEPEMWPSIHITSAGHVNATQVGRLDSHNAHSISPVEKCTKPTVTGVKIYNCAHCNYKTTRLSNLKRHIRKHTGEKPFSCEFCDFKCTEMSSLKVHLRTHTGDKPFRCEFCGYECTQSSNLIKHQRIHTGNKPFSCGFCNYKCSTSGSLKRHHRKHSGEKPFCCKFCDYKCAESGNLKIHHRTHTGDQL